jgi:small basic protein
MVKIVLGLGIGMVLGFGYHKLMVRCNTGCPNMKYPMLPVAVLGAIGGIIGSRIK